MAERKKKKSKSDAKASEQMRNWLTKPKTTTECTQPVSFQTFSKLVENLPDIAFQIQVTEIFAYKMTLDECAEWFYKEFYCNPAIRSKYEIELAPCPLGIRNKLLQLPMADSTDDTNRNTESSPGNDNDRPQNTDWVEVSVTKCGRFLFPVTFATFEQYVIKDPLLPGLVRKQTKDKAERKAILADNSKCRYILQKYYNSFYIFPSKRKLHKFGLKEAPPALQSQLLKEGIPLDELAKKTVEEFLKQFSVAAKLPEAAKSQDSISSIVSFAVFQKYVTNMHSIAWTLKLNDPEYACKGFDDCAFAYYLAFYLRPEIRERYAYQIAPCTAAMRQRLLALPNQKEVEALLEMERLNVHLPLSQELEIRTKPVKEQCKIAKGTEVKSAVLETIAEGATAKQKLTIEQSDETQPVTFALFKRFIKNLDRIVEEMLSCGEYAGKSKDECALEYFKAFYATPQIREKFPFEIKPCPSKMRQKLLSIPEQNLALTERSSAASDVDVNDNAIEFTDTPTAPAQLGHNLKEMTTAEDFEMQELISQVLEGASQPVEDQCKLANVPEEESKVLEPMADGATNKSKETQPVTFVLFKRFIKNLDKIVEEMLSCEEYAGRSQDECALEYFKAFYATPQIREKFPYELRPCPAKMRQKLLSIPEKNLVSLEGSSAATNATNSPAVSAQLRPDLIEMVTATDQQPPNALSSTMPRTCSYQERRGNERQPLTESHQPKTTVDINRNSNQNDGNKIVILDEKITICIENIYYEFPVSIQTFKRFINYDTLKVELAKRFAKSNNVEKLLSNERSNSILLQRFYHSFYIDKSIRKKFNYNFNAAPVEMQQKLLKFAVPRGEFEKLPAPQSANKIDSNATRKCNQKDVPVEPIVIVVPYDPAPQITVVSAEVPLSPIAPEQPVMPALPVVPVVTIAPPVSTVVPLAAVAPVQPIAPVTQVADPPAVSLPDQNRPSDNAREYPVSFRAFSNLLNLDDVVKQMQQEAHYAKMSAKECKLAYYKAFYRSPKIRNKYTYVMKPCPSILKAKILEIPVVISDHNYSTCSPERDSESVLADLYASRAAELSRLEKENVVDYVPHNLGSYIALRLQCPQKRALLEKHFIDRKRTKITTTSKAPIFEENTETSAVTSTDQEQELNRALKTPEVPGTANMTDLMEVVETTTTSEHEREISESVATATVDTTAPMEVVESTTATTTSKREHELSESVVTATVHTTSSMEIVQTAISQVVEKPALNEEPTSSTAETVVTEATKAATPTASTTVNVASISKDMSSTSSTSSKATVVATPTASTTVNVASPPKDMPSTLSASSKATIAATPTASTTVNVMSSAKEMPSTSSASLEATKAVSAAASTTLNTTESTTVNVASPSKDMSSNSSATSVATKATDSTTDSTKESTTVNVASISKDISSNLSESSSECRTSESASKAAEETAKSNKSITEPQTVELSLVSSRRNHTLSKLVNDFFIPNGKEHNLKYLIYTSHGLKKTIWRILSQLSFSEFKSYTSIYEGESLYKDESVLGRIYYHVIAKGHWPIRLYVKFSMLCELLNSKGVYIGTLDLEQLSPKIFGWHELSRFTNFEDIVNCDYVDQTGGTVEDVSILFTLVEQFYERCWLYDQWIQRVPSITVENLTRSLDGNDIQTANIRMLPATIPVCLIEHNANAPEVAIEVLSEEVSVEQHSFVDVDNVCPASQVAQTQNDPLSQTNLSVPLPIKQEPVEFLTRLRFIINSETNSEFICEPISTEQLIINLDAEDDERTAESTITEKEIPNLDNDEQMTENLATQVISKEDNDNDKSNEHSITTTIQIDDSEEILAEVIYEEKMASLIELESSESPEQMEAEAASSDATQGKDDQNPAEIQTSQAGLVESGQPEMSASQPISTENNDKDDETEPNVTSVIPLLSAGDIEYYQDILDEARLKEQMASKVSEKIDVPAASSGAHQGEVVQTSAETQNNSVLGCRRHSTPVGTVPVEPVPVQVKQEPVKFLTMMRFSMDSERSDEFKCEPITTEEEIINLDTEDDDLACFNITPPNVLPAIALLTNSEKEDFNDLINGARDQTLQEIPVSAAAPQVEAEQNPDVVLPVAAATRAATRVRKQQRGAASKVPAKKPRLMADNVPQLRHDFRPLPLTAMVRIEGNSEGREDGAEQELPTASSQGQMTASQTLALATDNTQLMESSQLQRLLDAPYINLRKVNVEASDSDKNDRATSNNQRSPPMVHIVFSTLQRYMYFKSLTTANITKYQINSLSLGNSYQQALICANGKLCNVYGPLLENLFPHCTASLLKDLQCLLQDIGEFSYNSRINAHREFGEDLRTRVLYAFMRAAPPFAHIRLQFENETREWANCSPISERDSDFLNRQPSCDVISGLRPEILERMREVKKNIFNP